MNTCEALKTEDLRVSAGERWMIWDTTFNEWVVYQKAYYKRDTKCLYRGDSEDEAIAVLVED